MEIERKWMVQGWPEALPLLYTELQEQGYVHAFTPIVRIRREERVGISTSYVLCMKSAGRLARQEIEIDVPEEKFAEIKELLGKPLIQKIRKVYQMPDGLKLEVNLVDEGMPTEFMYAEVEYESEEQAYAWEPEDCGLGSYLTEDVTALPGQSMAEYWNRTR